MDQSQYYAGKNVISMFGTNDYEKMLHRITLSKKMKANEKN